MNGTSLQENKYETFLKYAFLAIVYGLAAALVCFLFLAKDINEFHRAKFGDMVYGKADKPYVYRTFLPGTIRLIDAVSPELLKEKVANKFAKGMKQKQLLAAVSMRWEEEFLYQYLVACLLIFSCFFAFAWIMRSMIGTAYQYPAFVADLAPVFSLLFLAFFFRYRVYLYDPGTLLLFPLAIYAVLAKKRTLFFIAFIFACFNKETSLLLAGLYFLFEYKRSTLGKGAAQGALLGGIWLFIKASLYFAFRQNQGSFMEFHLIDHNLHIFLHQPLTAFYLIVTAGFAAIFVFKDWKNKPETLRLGFVVILLPLLGLSIFWGYIDELRVYYEAYPFLFLLALPTVLSLFNIQKKEELRFECKNK